MIRTKTDEQLRSRRRAEVYHAAIDELQSAEGFLNAAIAERRPRGVIKKFQLDLDAARMRVRRLFDTSGGRLPQELVAKVEQARRTLKRQTEAREVR